MIYGPIAYGNLYLLSELIIIIQRKKSIILPAVIPSIVIRYRARDRYAVYFGQYVVKSPYIDNIGVMIR
jgi:hypothetical protein